MLLDHIISNRENVVVVKCYVVIEYQNGEQSWKPTNKFGTDSISTLVSSLLHKPRGINKSFIVIDDKIMIITFWSFER